MKNLNFEKRSYQPEIMDDFDLQGEELKQTLSDLDKINTWLGGNKITLNGISYLLKNRKKSNVISIAEVGCGNGAMLRKIALWARKKKYKINLMGIDANSHAIEIAEKLSHEFPEICFREMNAFSEEFKTCNFDIFLSTLTLHHFKDNQIETLMERLVHQAKMGLVINDLQRSKTAYRLFQAFCAVFISNEIARKDGLTSISRGFKKEELKGFSKRLKAKTQLITWKWAFRYQWIIKL
jgi:2-polyprenyl-3-methyl-5-hydroxy-6-metoxy-1,4-benzoquinol methylase